MKTLLRDQESLVSFSDPPASKSTELFKRSGKLFASGARSVFVIACILYLMVNLGSAFLKSTSAEPKAVMPLNPPVMFIGSSVLAIPFFKLDYAKPHFPIQKFLKQHPISRVNTLERMLANNGNANVAVFSAASLGQMLDQSLSFLETELRGSHRPKIIVLGVAPICFLNGDTDPQVESKQTRLAILSKSIKQRLKPLFQLHSDRDTALPEFSRFLNATYFSLGLVEPEKRRWDRSQADYKIFYARGISKFRLDQLIHFTSICRSRNIRLLVVSSPLSKQNLQLMKDVSYEQYATALKTTLDHRCDFLDLGQSPQFSDGDFYDPAHANESGGKKMLNLIAPRLVCLLSTK